MRYTRHRERSVDKRPSALDEISHPDREDPGLLNGFCTGKTLVMIIAGLHLNLAAAGP